jgi:GNAT superfamily N-acetyltransferase
MERRFPVPSATSLGSLKSFTITEVTNPDILMTHRPQLCKILQDCVNEGSSIGFLAPLSIGDAMKYWDQVSDLITEGNLHLFILTATPPRPSTRHIDSSSFRASTSTPLILGTVQLVTIPKVTRSHRAEVVKLLVSPSTRRLGIATRLMNYIEDFARGTKRDMLTLDTATNSSALEMYRCLGWEEWGTCKGYACWPDGSRCDATFFRKEL